MSKKTENQIATLTEKQLAAVLDAALQTDAGQKKILACMDQLFADGKWEIPDDAVAGVVTNKVNQLEAQVKSLTSLLGQVSAQINGKPAPGRVDALAESSPAKNK